MERTQRFDYKGTWQNLSRNQDEAMINVASTPDEAGFAAMGLEDTQRLEDMVPIRPQDVVLEIGCGVGRIGRILAPRCAKWIGTDVSGHMIAYAEERLADLSNVQLIETNGYDLQPVPDGSVDVVYCTVVFMHLDEWDRYNYVVEAVRVLKPGGRLYVDNIDLTSPAGWMVFERHRRITPAMRPTHFSKTSTPQELQTYLERAGFDEIRLRQTDRWVCASGVRPAERRVFDAGAAMPARGWVVATDENFDEESYLIANQDVAIAVKAGQIVSGRAHFDAVGKQEGRVQFLNRREVT